MTKKINERKLVIDYVEKSINLNIMAKFKLYSYNPRYYQTSQDVFQAYSVIFNAFIQHQQNINQTVDFIDFLKYSVKNRHMVCDCLDEDYNFEIQDDIIVVKDKNLNLINFGELSIENYHIYACSSYLFILDTNTQKKYMYYGD